MCLFEQYRSTFENAVFIGGSLGGAEVRSEKRRENRLRVRARLPGCREEDRDGRARRASAGCGGVDLAGRGGQAVAAL